MFSFLLFCQVHLHGNDVKSVYKFFEPDILPEELGGKLGPAEKLKQVNENNTRQSLVANESKILTLQSANRLLKRVATTIQSLLCGVLAFHDINANSKSVGKLSSVQIQGTVRKWSGLRGVWVTQGLEADNKLMSFYG